MARQRVHQASFLRGELDPKILSRVDLAAYGQGLKKARNVIPVNQGGIERRSGSVYRADLGAVSRIEPFIFNESQEHRFLWTHESQKKQREGNSHDTTIPNAQNGKNGQLCGGGIKQINNPTHSNDRVYDESGVSPTLNTMQGGRRQPFVQMDTANTLDCDAYLRTGARPRDKEGKPQLKPIGERRIRRLTPTECERLQGFPDGYTKYGINEKGDKVKISDTQRYKCLGNAVTTNVVRGIIQKMEEYIEN